MTIFDLINACGNEWDVIRIYEEGKKGLKDLGSFFKFQEIPDHLLKSLVDTWSVNHYQDGGEVCEIVIIL